LTYHNRLDEQHPVKRILFASYNRIVEPLVLRSATRLLAVREEHFQRAHPRLASDPRIREVFNGVDTDLFRPMPMADARQTLNIPQDAPVALYVGALDQAHRFKNVDGLLHAFADLEIAGACLLIAGDGDLRPSLEALSARLRL